MTYHVLPVNDLKQHIEEGMVCWCEPTVINGDDNGMYKEPVIVHNSADGREWHEKFTNIKDARNVFSPKSSPKV